MKNDKLIISSELWLILHCDSEYCLIIKLNINKMEIKKVKAEDIVYKIVKEEVKLDLRQNTSDRIIDTKSLTLKQQKKYEQAKKILEFISENYFGLDWLIIRDERAQVFKAIAQKFNISDDTVRRLILCYLQGGMSQSALLSKYSNCGRAAKRIYTNKKTGPKANSVLARDEKMEKVFSIMTSRFMTGGAKTPITKLYYEMVYEFYSDKKSVGIDIIYYPYPVTLRPTLKQLRYWVKTHTDEMDREIKKIGKKSARNNIRPLFSDSIAYLDVKTIGSRYEMDEMETDFWLVNRLVRDHPIGRAIVYFIVDVFSRAIVACGIGLDNNSWSGAEIALLNMIENKKEFCFKYNIDIDEDVWPMKQAIPSSILVDNGAEYLSESFLEMAREVGLSIDFAPPRMGSYKSNVEQKFRQMNSLLKNSLPGEIDKSKYGQPHIKKASLDIYQFSQAVIHFIIEYNSSPIDNYPDSKEMIEKHLVLTPNNIWKFSLQKYNELTYIGDVDSYKYSLLKRDTASITRNGIEYKNRYYIGLDLDWLGREATKIAIKGCKRKKLNIRYDSRWPDIIYYENDKRRYKAYLNCPEVINNTDIELRLPVSVKTSNSKYAGLTEPEIEDVLKIKKIQKISNHEVRLQNKINTKSKINDIKTEALRLHKGVNRTHGIEVNRNEEKYNIYEDQHIVIKENDTENSNQDIKVGNKVLYNGSESKIDLSNMTRAEKIRWKEQQRIRNMNS